MVILLLCLLFEASGFSLNPNDLQKFIQEHNDSKEKRFGWSKAIYAIEKDLEDIALFYIRNEGIGNPSYVSRFYSHLDSDLLGLCQKVVLPFES